MSHVQNITDTHNTKRCDMYKSSLRHIHDPVLLSTKEIIFLSAQETCVSPSGTDPENSVGYQDTGSPGRPVPSGLQVSGESGALLCKNKAPW